MPLKLPCGFSTGLATIRQSVRQNYWYGQEEAGFKAVKRQPPPPEPTLNGGVPSASCDARNHSMQNFKLVC